ncbi:nucleoside-binding outer membrane protein [Pseudoalteromonas luteoviolacea]|uniref:Nucleoside-binding outer membrane protein n=1 Tax=Pseudoalteromonas luteoviolacea TaxID=43657 RepID=A0A0C1QCV4_9GAMM|nr:nucleoside-binding outer membrane protein [Pseudoalteromonas luteoviolacea]KID57260.1 nucleoside-binding outer membrane protein [Pseudoalteromonas luteoviolacea]
MNKKLSLTLSTALTCIASSAYAADWSNTQLHINHGDFKNPFSQNEANTTVYSLQHSSGYQYGDNFFFIDYLVDDLDDNYQDRDFYGEWYSTFSLSKTAGLEFQNGVIKDIGLVAGFNMAGDSKVMKYLPGVKVSWNAEGFSFLSTLFTAYIDDNEGVAKGGAPAESSSWMIDIAWGYPFNIGNQKFEVTGHVEYIAQRENELGVDVKGWLLAQPIVRWDLGHALEMSEGQLYLGLEWQYWRNKLGTDTNESVPQMHVAWTF